MPAKQPKSPEPKMRITIRDPVETTVATEDGQSDQPEGSILNRTRPEAEGVGTLPVAGENDVCPWDFAVDHKHSDQACLSAFLDSCLLEVGEACTKTSPRRCENRFDQQCGVSSPSDQGAGVLSEDMLCQWAAELMD